MTPALKNLANPSEVVGMSVTTGDPVGLVVGEVRGIHKVGGAHVANLKMTKTLEIISRGSLQARKHATQKVRVTITMGQ